MHRLKADQGVLLLKPRSPVWDYSPLVAHSTCWWNLDIAALKSAWLEIPCWHRHSVRIRALLIANARMQKTNSRASISILWDVNSRYHDHSELPREINGPAYQQMFRVLRAGTVVRVAAVVHVQTNRAASSALSALYCSVISPCGADYSLSSRTLDEARPRWSTERMHLSACCLQHSAAAVNPSSPPRCLAFVRNRLWSGCASRLCCIAFVSSLYAACASSLLGRNPRVAGAPR